MGGAASGGRRGVRCSACTRRQGSTSSRASWACLDCRFLAGEGVEGGAPRAGKWQWYPSRHLPSAAPTSSARRRTPAMLAIVCPSAACWPSRRTPRCPPQRRRPASRLGSRCRRFPPLAKHAAGGWPGGPYSLGRGWRAGRCPPSLRGGTRGLHVPHIRRGRAPQGYPRVHSHVPGGASVMSHGQHWQIL